MQITTFFLRHLSMHKKNIHSRTDDTAVISGVLPSLTKLSDSLCLCFWYAGGPQCIYDESLSLTSVNTAVKRQEKTCLALSLKEE